MDDRLKKSFDLAESTTKQLITNSTAVITISVTFLRNVLPNLSEINTSLLKISWSFHFASIFCGIVTLSALTGALGKDTFSTLIIGSSEHQVTEKLTIYSLKITIPSMLQQVTFLLGLFTFVWFAWANLHTPKLSDSSLPMTELSQPASCETASMKRNGISLDNHVNSMPLQEDANTSVSLEEAEAR